MEYTEIIEKFVECANRNIDKIFGLNFYDLKSLIKHNKLPINTDSYRSKLELDIDTIMEICGSHISNNIKHLNTLKFNKEIAKIAIRDLLSIQYNDDDVEEEEDDDDDDDDDDDYDDDDDDDDDDENIIEELNSCEFDNEDSSNTNFINIKNPINASDLKGLIYRINPDYEFLGTLDFWNVTKTILLFFEVDTVSRGNKSFWHKHDIASEEQIRVDFANELQELHLPNIPISNIELRFNSLMNVIHSVDIALKTGILEYIDPLTKSCISPHQFIKWAISKNIHIQKELKDIADLHRISYLPSYLDKSHDNYSSNLEVVISAWTAIFENRNYENKKEFNLARDKWFQNYNISVSAEDKLANDCQEIFKKILNSRLNNDESDQGIVRIAKSLQLRSTDNKKVIMPKYLLPTDPNFSPELMLGIYTWLSLFHNIYTTFSDNTPVTQIENFLSNLTTKGKIKLSELAIKRIVRMINFQRGRPKS